MKTSRIMVRRTKAAFAASAPSCGQCHYFEPQEGGKVGYCHRHPPTAMLDADGDIGSQWSITKPNGWCGEFKGRQ